MNKYWIVIKNTWNEVLTYRASFIAWRARNVIQFLALYFLWFSITPAHGEIFGYNQIEILTYILGASLVGAIVFSTRTGDIGGMIINGDLSIFLLRPFSFFKYFFSKDLGDKAMNIAFSSTELLLLYLILRPEIFIQTNLAFLILFILSLVLAIILHFFISCILGIIGFWGTEVWAPRFIFYVLLGYLSGGAFPLDIVGQNLYNFLKILPFFYLLFFPIKIFLGQFAPGEILLGFAIGIIWIFILGFLLKFAWRRGLRVYGAYGR